jgi:hypothetical protein
VVRAELIEEITRVQDALVPIVHEIQDCQRDDGSVDPSQTKEAHDRLRAVAAELRTLKLATERSQDAAFEQDLAEWEAEGLETPPRFDASRDAIDGPADGELAMFVGPAYLANAETRSPLFQTVVIVRDEPAPLRILAERYPHPTNKCQSTRLLAGSRHAKGGECVVLFPENVPARTPVVRQRFAWFFMNKHVPVLRWSLDQVDRWCGDSLFGAGEEMATPALDRSGVYDTRCIWAYLHEYHHHNGPRPLATNLATKTQWYTGLLEELKVDCQSLQVCLADEQLPYRAETFEFVLLDRLFRYPQAADALVNSDAGAGVMLGTWLLRQGVVRGDGERAQLASRAEVVRAVDRLVDEIVALEKLDDSAYPEQAEAFALSVLDPPGSGDDRYAKPADWTASIFAKAGASRA